MRRLVVPVQYFIFHNWLRELLLYEFGCEVFGWRRQLIGLLTRVYEGLGAHRVGFRHYVGVFLQLTLIWLFNIHFEDTLLEVN